MKIFISQGMRGKMPDEIEETRNKAKKYAYDFFGKKYPNTNIEIIDTYFKDFKGSRLEFLGKAVSEGIAKCDAMLFVGDWENYAGCRVEHLIAKEYSIATLYYREN